MGTMCEKMDNHDYSKIIRVREESGKQLVSARELYIGLGYDLSHYTRWIKKNIIDNSFCEEGIDWCSFVINGEPDNETYNPNPTKDYVLSIDLAKKLAMMVRTEIGNHIYDYLNRNGYRNIKCNEIAEDSSTIKLSKQSNDHEIKAYFKYVLKITKQDNEFPVNLDNVWPLVYNRKREAVRALTNEGSSFIENVDYLAVRNNAQGGQFSSTDYYLSTSCLEFFIARKVRPVFEVYRLVFHKATKHALELPQDYLSALKALVISEEEKQKALEIAKENELKVKERDKYIKSNHHKVDFYDDCVYEDDETTYDMNGTAKIVMAKYNKGRNTMMNILRICNVLMYDNLPYEKYIRSGYFTVKITKPKDKFGNTKICKSTIVTSRGVAFLKKIIDKYYSELS